MTTEEDSEQRIADALRAHAIGAGRTDDGVMAAGVPHAVRAPRPPDVRPVDATDPTLTPPDGPRPSAPAAAGAALLLALIAGVVFGIALALLSLLVPGLLPPLG